MMAAAAAEEEAKQAAAAPSAPVADLFPSPPAAAPSEAQPPPAQPQQPEPERRKGGSLPPPPNVVGMLWELTLNAGRFLGVPVPDPDLPKTMEEKEERFREQLAIAQGESTAEFDALECAQLRGADLQGRRILVLSGAKLPAFDKIDRNRFARFIYKKLALIAHAPFIVVYFHTDVTEANRPGASWLWNAFEVLPETVQEHLEAMYVVHPMATLRGTLAILPFWIFTPFSGGGLSHKIHYLDRLELLWEHAEPAEVQVPAYVVKYDEDLAESRAKPEPRARVKAERLEATEA